MPVKADPSQGGGDRAALGAKPWTVALLPLAVPAEALLLAVSVTVGGQYGAEDNRAAAGGLQLDDVGGPRHGDVTHRPGALIGQRRSDP